MGFLKYYEGRDRDIEFFLEAEKPLIASRKEQQQHNEEVLARTLGIAGEIPLMQQFGNSLAKIGSVESLEKIGFYMRSDELLPRDNSKETWQRLLGNITLRYDACTSGSTGLPKFMAYTQESTELAALSLAGYFAETLIRLHEQKIKPVLLSLTGAEQFVTYKAIPQLGVDMGMNVVHIPLRVALNNEEAARELATYLENHDVHGIITLPNMVSPLEHRLESISKKAAERLFSTLVIGGFGGSEIYPNIEAYLAQKCGKVVNLYASTEFLIPIASDGKKGCQVQHINPSYAIAGIIPLEELEKESESYVPKMTLLQNAPIGTKGELVLTLASAIPWINARTDDYVEVVDGNGKYNTPAVSYWAKGSSILDIGGAKVYPEEFNASMNALEARVGDWLIQAVKGQELGKIHDVLKVHYEGEASPQEVYDSLVKNTSEFGVFASEYPLFEVEISNVPVGSIQAARAQKMQDMKGAPGPMKHKILKQFEYQMLPTVGSAFSISHR
ncbi:MAG: AMP-binding protein [archaeon]